MTDPVRVHALLSLEITRVLSDLEARRALLVRLWSVHRDRWPLSDVAFSRWKTLRHAQLDVLRPDAAVAVDDFYETLEALQDYVATTVDMPLHLDWQLRAYLTRLSVTGRTALARLGPTPVVAVPDIDRDGETVLDGLLLEEMAREARATLGSAEE